MALDRPATLRIDPTSPALGGQVFFLDIDGAGRQVIQPTPVGTVAPLDGIRRGLAQLQWQVEQLTLEVIALRTDLAEARVQAAALSTPTPSPWRDRGRALWAWVRAQLSRIRS